MAKKSRSNSEETKRKIGRLFAKQLIARMNEISASDWQQGWVDGPKGVVPQNIQGRPYTGGNPFFLLLDTAKHGYAAPIYATDKMIFKLNDRLRGKDDRIPKDKLDQIIKVKKGEHYVPVLFWLVNVKDKDGNKITQEDYDKLSSEDQNACKKYFDARFYPVFNIDQTNMAEVDKDRYQAIIDKATGGKLNFTNSNGMYSNAALDRMFDKQEWLCPIHVDVPRSDCFYRPSVDAIYGPMKGQFKMHDESEPEELYKDGMEFYSSIVHEMAHSTGSPKRLDREGGKRFGDAKYAKEELVAEITAAMTGSILGFDKRIKDNNIAYVKNWLETLKEKPEFILDVMTDVEKASDMILAEVEKQEKKIDAEQGQSEALAVKTDERPAQVEVQTLQPEEHVVVEAKSLPEEGAEIINSNDDIQERVDAVSDSRTMDINPAVNPKELTEEEVKDFREGLQDTVRRMKNEGDSDLRISNYLDDLKAKWEESPAMLSAIREAGKMISEEKKDWYVSVNFLQNSEDTAVFEELESKDDYKGILQEARNYDFSAENDWDLQDTFKGSPKHYSGDDIMDEDEDYAIVKNDSVGGSYTIFRRVTESEVLDEAIRQGYGEEKIGDLGSDLSDDVKSLVNQMVDEKKKVVSQSENIKPSQELAGDKMQKQLSDNSAPVDLMTAEKPQSKQQEIDKIFSKLTEAGSELQRNYYKNEKFFDKTWYGNHLGMDNVNGIVSSLSYEYSFINNGGSDGNKAKAAFTEDFKDAYRYFSELCWIADCKGYGYGAAARGFSPSAPLGIMWNESYNALRQLDRLNDVLGLNFNLNKLYYEGIEKSRTDFAKAHALDNENPEAEILKHMPETADSQTQKELYDVIAMKNGNRETIKTGLTMEASAKFVERNDQRYQRKGYDYLISMSQEEKTINKSLQEQNATEKVSDDADRTLMEIQENGGKAEGMYYFDALHEEYVKLGKLSYDEGIFPHYGYNTVYGRVNAWVIMRDFHEGKLKTKEQVQKLQARTAVVKEAGPRKESMIQEQHTQQHEIQDAMETKKEQEAKQKAAEAQKEAQRQKEQNEKQKQAQEQAKQQQQQQKEQEEKKDSHKSVSSAVVQSTLLITALEFAKAHGGLFLNPSGKAAPQIINSKTSLTPYNQVMLALKSDQEGWRTNAYTFMKPAADAGMPVRKGEKSTPANWVQWSYKNTQTGEVIDSKKFKDIPESDRDLYERTHERKSYPLFNVDQTVMNAKKHDEYINLLNTVGQRFETIKDFEHNDLAKRTTELMAKLPHTVVLYKNGENIEAYGGSAKKLQKFLSDTKGFKTSEVTNEAGKKTLVATFPENRLNANLKTINKNGERITFLENKDMATFIKNPLDTKAVVLDALQDLDKVTRTTGVKMERVMRDVPVEYDASKDTITYSGVGKDDGTLRSVSASVEKANDLYRSLVSATNSESRLDLQHRVNMTPEDAAAHVALVRDMAAGVLMTRHGLPSSLSVDTMNSIDHLINELKENPNKVNLLERGVNTTLEVIDKAKIGRTVDYAKIRGEKSALADSNAMNYSIIRNLQSMPDKDTKEIVVIKDKAAGKADVILPQGASLEANNEAPGMSKVRITKALSKEGISDVTFYNARGGLGLNQPNAYFQGKDITLSKLKQYELQTKKELDVSSAIAKSQDVKIEKFRSIKDDNGKYVFFIKPEGEKSFSVQPSKDDVTKYYDAVRTKDKQIMNTVHGDLEQKYYRIATNHPEYKREVIMPDTSKVDSGKVKIENATITRDKGDNQVYIQAHVDGKFMRQPATPQQWDRMWLADDMQEYKNAVAAVTFAPKIEEKQSESQSQSTAQSQAASVSTTQEEEVKDSQSEDKSDKNALDEGGKSAADDGKTDAPEQSEDKEESEEEEEEVRHGRGL